MSERFGFCLVGPGGIAGMHMRALAAIEACEPRWVVGDLPDATAEFARRWHFAHATSDLGEALADDSVELVYITSPSPLHAAQAREALLAGKHVAVEIPVAMSLAETEMLAELSASTGRRLQVCHTMRSYPAFRTLRDRVSAGTLGISQMLSVSATARRHNENWVGGTRAWVDNLLWHHACHVVDAALWVLGMPDPVDVSARAGVTNREFGMTMDLTIGFATEASQLITHVLTYNTRTDLGEWRLVTDDDLLVVRDGALANLAGETIVAEHEWSDLSVQDSAIVRAIRSGEPSDFDVESVLPTMRLLERCQELSGVR
jgi:2-hydroxy-4-carboxymuconate semialdehyde hemiacetal dehydrogenase